MTFRKIVFVSNLNDKACSERILRAANLAKLEIEFSTFTLPVAHDILSRKYGAVIVDIEHEPKMGNFLHNIVRVKRGLVPFIMFSENVILLDQYASKKIDPTVSDERFANYLYRSVEFYEKTIEFEKEFYDRFEEIKHLTGDELKVAEEALRKEIWERKFSELEEKESLEDPENKNIHKLEIVKNENHTSSISP